MDNTEPNSSNKPENIPLTDSENTQINNSKKNTKLSKITIFSIVFLGIILIAGVATAAYTQIVLNNPDRIWQDATANTREGIDEVSSQIETANFNGGQVSGSLNIESPIVATASMEGKWFNNNTEISSETSIAGIDLQSEVRAVNNSNTSNPDFYIKIDGLDSAASFSELLLPGSKTLLEQANNNWYKVESSDIEELAELPVEINTEDLGAGAYKEEVEKVKNLIKDFILTEDQSKVAFNYTPIGNEDFNGREAYKYDVKPNKERLEELLKELEAVFEEVQALNVPGADDITEDINLQNITETDLNKEVKVEVWVDTELRYFRNVRIYLDADSEPSIVATGNYIDFGLNYNGDDELPFYVNYKADRSSNTGEVDVLITASLNRLTTSIKLQFDINAKAEGQTVKASGTLQLTPSEEEVQVQVPETFETLDSLLGNIFGSGLIVKNELELFDDSGFCSMM
jgi:hypothetical protein